MTDTDPTAHTELQKRLASPLGPEIRAAHQARLQELVTSIRKQLNSGVSPADYAIGRALEKAVTTASEILEQHTDTGEQASTGLPKPAPATIASRTSSYARRP